MGSKSNCSEVSDLVRVAVISVSSSRHDDVGKGGR